MTTPPPSVVTGQQAGLFGGPMYTLYKLLGAIALAESRGHRAVFWIECDDADIREADTACVNGSASGLARVTTGEPDDGRPVASRILGEGITVALKSLAEAVGGGDHATAELATLGAEWALGRRWPEAFAATLDRLAGRGRASLFDPTTTAAKRDAAGVFARVIGEADQVEQALSDGAALVASATVEHRPGELPLFLLDDAGIRRKLERVGADFRMRGQTQSYSSAELTALVDRSPELFSPAVLLRPLVQDHLLGTTDYIAGPSEAAYHAQLPPLYAWFGREQPRVLSRPRFTLVEPRARRVIAKLDLSTDRVLAGRTAILAELATRSGLDPRVPMEVAIATIANAIDQLASRLLPIDGNTMTKALDESRSKIRYQLDKLGERAHTALRRRDGHAAAQVDRALSLLLPDDKPQERVLSPIHFLARMTPAELRARLEAKMDPGDLGRDVIVDLE